MEGEREKHEKKASRRSFKTSKSATLPAGAVLMDQPGEGFFSKIRRSFKIRKKNKFILQHSLDVAEASDRVDTDCLSKSTDSLKKTDTDQKGAKGKSRPHQMSQEANLATENVVLVSSKLRKCSSGTDDCLAPVEESSNRATSINHATDECRSEGKQTAAAEAPGMCSVTEDNNNDKYFDDFDPDYETLDNIRRQVHSQTNSERRFPVAKAGADLADAGTSVMSHSDRSHGPDSGELDSGLTSASLSVFKEHQGRSVADPCVHRCQLPSDGSEPLNTNESDAVNGVSSVGLNGVASSQTFVSTFDDDLYANAKVLMRKQLRKFHELPSDEADVHQPKVVSGTSFSAECRKDQHPDSSESVCPPPLPARNYSEKDMALPADAAQVSEGCRTARKQTAVSSAQSHSSDSQRHSSLAGTDGVLNSSPTSDVSKCDKEVSNPFRRDSAFIELGPVVTLLSDQHYSQGNNCDRDISDTQLHLPCSQCSQTVLKPTDCMDKPLAEKPCTDELSLQNAQESKSFRQMEDDLLFIDEDPVEDLDFQVKQAATVECAKDHQMKEREAIECDRDHLVKQTQMECVRGAEPSATPDTVCGDDTAHHHVENNTSTGSVHTGQHTASAVIPAAPETAQNMKVNTKSKSRGSQNHQEQGHSDNHGLECGSSGPESRQSRSTTENVPPQKKRGSLSEFYHKLFPSSSASAMPPESSHHAGDGAIERRLRREDRRPQVRPRSANLSQRFPPFPHRTRSMEENPPPLPFRTNMAEAAERKVVSEELPLRGAKDLDDNHELRKNRRHASAVGASRAHSDFLKSMKQLKECGWYWGPLSSDEAVSKLTDKCDGSFLVRDSSSDKYLLTISFKHNNHVHHTRIEFHKGLFSFWEKPDEHSKAHICQFIEQTVEHSRKGNYIYFQRSTSSTANPLPIQLLYPVSRFYRVPSLQHICRFLILRRVRRDHIDELPLPQKVKGYLSERQYYVEMLTED